MKITPAAWAVFTLEIRSLLRDPRTILMSIVVPVLLIPAGLGIASWIEDRSTEREEARVYRFAIAGSDSAFAAQLTDALVPGPDGSQPGARFRRGTTDDPRAALEVDSLDLYLETFTAEEWDALREQEGTAGTGVPPELEGARILRIRFHSSRAASREGAQALYEHLLEAREGRRDSIIAAAGFPVPPEQVAAVAGSNVASDREVQGGRLGRFLTLAVVGLMILGGSTVSIDTLAGEKERGTLVTLLTSAAARTEIVTGKLMAIMAVAFAVALVQILNLWLFLGFGLIDPAAGFQVTVSPGLAAGLLVLYLPVAALTSGVLLLSSAYAHSYREAQLYLTPVLLGLAIPTLAPVLPEVSLQSAILAVPLANVSVAARDLLVGQAYLPAVAAAWLITAAAATWVTGRSIMALHDENLVTGETTREEFLGGPELFQKRVLRWFLAFWAAKVLVDFNLPFDDVRLVAFVSVGLVFLAFPVLVIRYFRLNAAEALALRSPRPGVWLGVLLGAPAGLVAANTVFRLMGYVLPMPTQLLENFGQSLMPELPLWQLVLFLAVIPGIAEELTFRGVLLHGLRRRFGPVGLALFVGIAFGFFHFQIFRIPATAALGVMLTAVTLLSGSIFPAIVWHVLNNALAVYLSTQEVELGLESWWWGAGSVLALALAFLIIWRHRTSYPEVGPGAARALSSRERRRSGSGRARPETERPAR